MKWLRAAVLRALNPPPPPVRRHPSLGPVTLDELGDGGPLSEYEQMQWRSLVERARERTP